MKIKSPQIIKYILLFIFIASAINEAQPIVQNNRGLRLFYLLYTANGGYRIMLIDEDGNVLRRSKPLLQTNWTFPENGAAIGRSANGFLNLYTPQPNQILVHRIDEKTLQIKRSLSLSVPLLVSGILNVTDRKENNFLSALLGNEEKRYFMGFGLTNSGDFRGDRWVIRSFNCLIINNYCFGPRDAGISLNGTTAYFSNLDGLFKMNLDSKQRGIHPKLLVKAPEAGSGTYVGSADFSAFTSVNEKLFVYNAVTRAGGSDPGAPDFVYIGKTRNGVLINRPTKIAQYPWIESGQTVAIDPNRKFVIYYAASQENDHLMYQKVNENGTPSGKKKVLESAVFPILDIAPYD